ncbi:hypothetical protein ACFLWU_03395 [Chloroflexota bacterium]
MKLKKRFKIKIWFVFKLIIQKKIVTLNKWFVVKLLVLKKRLKIKIWSVIKILVLSLYIGCVVTYFLWGIDYVYLKLVEKPTREHEQLTLEIESSRNELANIPDLVFERGQRLVQAQELLANEQSKIPSTLNINNLVRNIIEIANECQVKAIPLHTTPPQSKILGQSSYNCWQIFMSVEGEFQNIANFVENVDGNYISTSTVVNTVLDRGKESQNSSNIQNYTANVSGKIELVVYSRPQVN